MNEYVVKNELEALPDFYTGASRFGLRYLQGCKWNNEDAYKAIFDHHKFRVENFPMD